MIVAELTRLTILKKLREHIREPVPEDTPLEKIPNKDFAPSDLAPHIRD